MELCSADFGLAVCGDGVTAASVVLGRGVDNCDTAVQLMAKVIVIIIIIYTLLPFPCVRVP